MACRYRCCSQYTVSFGRNGHLLASCATSLPSLSPTGSSGSPILRRLKFAPLATGQLGRGSHQRMEDNPEQLQTGKIRVKCKLAVYMGKGEAGRVQQNGEDLTPRTRRCFDSAPGAMNHLLDGEEEGSPGTWRGAS